MFSPLPRLNTNAILKRTLVQDTVEPILVGTSTMKYVDNPKILLRCYKDMKELYKNMIEQRYPRGVGGDLWEFYQMYMVPGHMHHLQMLRDALNRVHSK